MGARPQRGKPSQVWASASTRPASEIGLGLVMAQQQTCVRGRLLVVLVVLVVLVSLVVVVSPVVPPEPVVLVVPVPVVLPVVLLPVTLLPVVVPPEVAELTLLVLLVTLVLGPVVLVLVALEPESSSSSSPPHAWANAVTATRDTTLMRERSSFIQMPPPRSNARRLE